MNKINKQQKKHFLLQSPTIPFCQKQFVLDVIKIRRFIWELNYSLIGAHSNNAHSEADCKLPKQFMFVKLCYAVSVCKLLSTEWVIHVAVMIS